MSSKEPTDSGPGLPTLLSRQFWRLRRFTRRLWVRVALISALALAAAALAPFLTGILPDQVRDRIDTEDLSRILAILTNSMLAVTTFSLSIMVTAHLSADKNVTPRAHRLLQEDGRTQTVLATFVGAFIYALALTVLQHAGFVGDRSAAVVYLVSVGVVLGVVLAILRWIAHLDGLGSVESTAQRVEERARDAIDHHNRFPFLGAQPLPASAAMTAGDGHADAGWHDILAPRFGYLGHVDIDGLSDRMEKWGGDIRILVRPGAWVARGETLGATDVPDFDTEREAELAALFAFSEVRGFDPEPTHALSVLGEIAERALSPGINDPQTALDMVGRLERLFDRIAPEAPTGDGRTRVHVVARDLSKTLEETFGRIARDGAAMVEIQIAVQAALTRLAGHSDMSLARAAQAVSARALAHARDGLTLADDYARVAALALAKAPAAPAASHSAASA